jgi:hypothetical protein
MGLKTPHHKKIALFQKHLTKPQTWKDYWDKQLKLRNMDMRFGTWNIRSLYRAGSLVTVSKALSKYKLDLVGGQWHRTSRRIQIFLGKGE